MYIVIYYLLYPLECFIFITIGRNCPISVRWCNNKGNKARYASSKVILVSILREQWRLDQQWLLKIAKNSIIAMRFYRFLLCLQKNQVVFCKCGGANLYQFFFRDKICNFKKSWKFWIFQIRRAFVQTIKSLWALITSALRVMFWSWAATCCFWVQLLHYRRKMGKSVIIIID